MSSGVTIYRPGASFSFSLGKDNFYAAFIPAVDDRLYDAQQRMDSLRALPGFAKLKALYLQAAPNKAAALMSWVNPQAALATKVGNLTFTADRGYQSPDLTGYIRTGLLEPGLGIGQNDITLCTYIGQAAAATNVNGADITMGASNFIVGYSSGGLLASEQMARPRSTLQPRLRSLAFSVCAELTPRTSHTNEQAALGRQQRRQASLRTANWRSSVARPTRPSARGRRSPPVLLGRT